MKSVLFILIMLSLAPNLRAEPSKSEITFQRDIVYETIDNADIKLDLAIPNGPGPFPLILCIHGGAWRVGDKSKFTPMIENLARHGYVAASMNYRFAPKYRFPAQLDDAKTALRFLKERSKPYKVDVMKVGGTGESAGSHLAMLMGFMDDQKNATPITSTHFQAIVNYYGPVNLTNWEVAPLVQFMWQRKFHENLENAMLEFLGSESKDDPKVKAASPLTYVSENCPPVLTFHGTLDPVVPYHQAEILQDALENVGVPSKLVPIPNGFHGAWAPDAKKRADDEAITFFDKYLKGIDPKPGAGSASAGESPSTPKANPMR